MALISLFQDTLLAFVDEDAEVSNWIRQNVCLSGYSGSRLDKYLIYFNTAEGKETIELVTKLAPIQERQTLHYLQKYKNIPFTFIPDLGSREPRLICQQYVGRDHDYYTPEILRKVSHGLANIHFANLIENGWIDFVPIADFDYFKILSEYYWQPAWKFVSANDGFLEGHGHLLEKLSQALEKYYANMIYLMSDEESQTLIHADMHPGHILVYKKVPYFIDWGQAKVGSFFLDLPYAFGTENIQQYYKAITSLGYRSNYYNFLRRYKAATTYIAVKYIPWYLTRWDDLTEQQLDEFTFLTSLIFDE